MTTFEQLPGRQQWLIIGLATTTLGGLDYATGFELSSALFYLIPVSLAAWAAGRRAGVGVSAVCAVVWLGSNVLAGEQYTHQFIFYWNTLIRLGFFLVTTVLLAELRQMLERERLLSRTDPLTGLVNRRAFYELCDREMARARRYRHAFTVLYIDLDNFKTVNDQLGHDAGDRLLY